MNALTDSISAVLAERFQCTPQGEFVRVRTPLLHPDGDVVDLFLKEQDGGFTVTDLGASLGWLRQQTISSRRSLKQEQVLQDVCQTLGVETFKGQLMLRCRSLQELGEGVLRLGQAALRVADLWFTLRTGPIETVTDDVSDFLTERGIPLARGPTITGRSGRQWTIDFRTRLPQRSALVSVLSAGGSRAAAHRIAEHVAACWFDIKGCL